MPRPIRDPTGQREQAQLSFLLDENRRSEFLKNENGFKAPVSLSRRGVKPSAVKYCPRDWPGKTEPVNIRTACGIR